MRMQAPLSMAAGWSNKLRLTLRPSGNRPMKLSVRRGSVIRTSRTPYQPAIRGHQWVCPASPVMT